MQRPARDNEARGTKDTFFKGASSVVVAPNGDIFVVERHGLLPCMSPEIAIGWVRCDAAVCPESGLKQRCMEHARNVAIDPKPPNRDVPNHGDIGG
jgi:hypothetical protein